MGDASSGARVVRGTVTPSRASRFFLPREVPEPRTPEIARVADDASTPYLESPTTRDAPPSTPSTLWCGPRTPSASDTESADEAPASPTLACKRRAAHSDAGRVAVPLGPRPLALASRRARRVPCASAHHYLTRFRTDLEQHYLLDSAAVPHGTASPLCAAYMHRAGTSRAAGQCLAVGDDEGRVHVLDTLEPPGTLGRQPYRTTTPALADGSVYAVEWRFDDRALALGASDYTVCVWDAEKEARVAAERRTLTQQRTARWDAHGGSIRSLAWDPAAGGQLLASGARDGAIYLWDVRMAHAALHIPRAQDTRRTMRRAPPAPTAVTALAYVPGAARLVSAGRDSAVVTQWDVRAVRRPASAAPAATPMLSHRRRLAVSGDASQLSGWNSRPHGISSLAVAPVRCELYAACTDGCVYVLDAGDVARERAPGAPHALYDPVQQRNTLYARLALWDERFLALGCNTGDVVLWDVAAPVTSSAGAARLATQAVVPPRAHEKEYAE